MLEKISGVLLLQRLNGQAENLKAIQDLEKKLSKVGKGQQFGKKAQEKKESNRNARNE